MARVKRVLGITAVALLVAALALAFAPRRVRWFARLLVRDEVRALREPLRAPSGGPRVLIFALDGVSDAQLRKALREGYLPTLAALAGREGEGGLYAHAYAAPDVLSILPSTTMAAWSSVYTGQTAAHTGVPGNEWFEREHMTFMAPAPVSISAKTDTLRMLTVGLVGDAVRTPTLFELADRRSYVSLAPVYRGADVFSAPGSHAVLGLLSDFRNLFRGSGRASREAYSEIDDESVEVFAETVEELGAPDLGVVYFPGIDLFTHEAHDPLADQLSYMRETLDHSMGQVLDAYRARGAFEGLTILLVADHGHTPVLRDDRHALEAEGDDEPTAVLARAGFRLRSLERKPEGYQEDYQAAVAFQGAFAYVYLADRSTCLDADARCDWQRPPRFEEDVMAVVRAFHAANQPGSAVPALEGTLDLILAREPSPVAEPARPFRVYDGERLVSLGDWARTHPRPDLLELEARLDGLGQGPYGHRAGDVLLLARSRADRPIEERFYFSRPYRSWHGSPSRQDSTIPLILLRPGTRGEALRDEMHAAVGEHPSQLSITPLVRALLAAPAASR